LCSGSKRLRPGSKRHRAVSSHDFPTLAHKQKRR
jgi:hypothetical protein